MSGAEGARCAPTQASCARLRGSGDEHDLFESRAPKAPVALHLRLAALAFVDRETSTTCLKVGRRRLPLRSNFAHCVRTVFAQDRRRRMAYLKVSGRFLREHS